MIAEQPVERFVDLEDGPESLGRDDDGKIPQYSWQDDRFVMVDIPKSVERPQVGIAAIGASSGGGGATRLRDMTDVSGTLDASSDGYAYLYDNDTDTFVLSEISTTSTIAGASDFTDTTGAGTDGYSVVWDNATSRFVLSEITGGGGTPGGSNAQVQYNSADNFAGHSGFTYDGSGTAELSSTLVVPTVKPQVIQPETDSTAAIEFRSSGGLRKMAFDSTNGYLTGDGAGNAFIHLSNTVGAKVGYTSDDYFFHGGSSGGFVFSSVQQHRFDTRGFAINNTDTTVGSFSLRPLNSSYIGMLLTGATSQTADLVRVRDASSNNLFRIGADGKLMSNQTATNTNTPSGATAHQLPIYDEGGTLLGYIPVYGSAW